MAKNTIGPWNRLIFQADDKRFWSFRRDSNETLLKVDLVSRIQEQAGPMTKVMVIGNAGGGKSTMCRALCSVHSLPHIAIDKLQWRAGWVQTSAEDYDKTHDSVISGERWLVDGYGSWESVLGRMDAADTIIVVDHPIWIHYWWATKRQVKSLFIERPDGPSGCPMWPVTLRLYKMMWWLHTTQRSKLLTEAGARASKKRFIHIRSPAELKKFVSDPV